MAECNHLVPDKWRAQVGRVHLRIVLGWFWSSLVVWVFAASLVGSLLSWMLSGMGQHRMPGWLTGLGLMVVGVLLAWSHVSARELRRMDAVARLDEGWGMNQSLVRAYSGHGIWPDMPKDRQGVPLHIRWQAWAPPVCLSLLCIALSQWIPVMESAPSVPLTRTTPAEWKELESLVETLQEEEFVEPEALSDVEDQLDRLQALPEEEWYGPAGLEATDRLRLQVQTETNRLTRDMQKTAQLLQLAEQHQNTLSMNQQAALQQEMEQMVQEMSDNGLPLSEKQLSALRQVDLSQLSQISKEQLQQLQDQLQGHAQAAEAALMAAGLLVQGSENGPPGTEGGGPADLRIGDETLAGNPLTDVILDVKEAESLQVGDLLETREIEHRETRMNVIPSAGTVSGPGGSGSATWQRDLPPSEQRVLQQFFKSNASQ